MKKNISLGRRLTAVLLSSAMVFGCGTAAFAEEAAGDEQPAVATEDIIAEAGITADDLEAAALYFKNNNEFESEYHFALAAAALGSGEAMLWLGELYQGINVEDAKEADDPVAVAIDWWTKAAENGQPRGYANIGLLYAHEFIPGGGTEYGDIEYDEDKALEYYLMATEAGDSKAPRYVGLCYQDGVGVDVDEEKAFEYFKLAADREDSTGIVYYADYLLAGRGCEQDIDAALALYQNIVDTNGHDIVLCALTLGDIYKEGEYVEADPEKAAEYYEIVLENAHEGSSEAEEAQAALDELEG